MDIKDARRLSRGFLIILGAVGGAVYELLILQGRIERPHHTKDKEILKQLSYAIGA